MTSSLNTRLITIIRKRNKMQVLVRVSTRRRSPLSLTWLKGRTRTATRTPSVLGRGVVIVSHHSYLFGRKIRWKAQCFCFTLTHYKLSQHKQFVSRQSIMNGPFMTRYPWPVINYLTALTYAWVSQATSSVPLNCAAVLQTTVSGFSSLPTSHSFPVNSLCLRSYENASVFKPEY